jgi:hypothetical protein
MKTDRCIGCNRPFWTLDGRKQLSIICHSSIFGATQEDVLCEACSKVEEKQIDENGTNDLPQLLAIYVAHRHINKGWTK